MEVRNAMSQTNQQLKIMKSKLEVLFVPEKDRYTQISIDGPSVKVDVLTELPRLCKVVLQGCESPIFFQLKTTPIDKVCLTSKVEEYSRADLVIYLSTEVREPSSGHCQRMVDRHVKFRFDAPANAGFFDDDAVLYMTLESTAGCEATLKVISAPSFQQAKHDE